MNRILLSLTIPLLALAIALPRAASAAPAALDLPCSPSSGQNAITCRLSGSGFAPGEKLTITYRIVLPGKAGVQTWSRKGQADSRGKFVRPVLGFAVSGSKQPYRVTVTVVGTSGKRTTLTINGVYNPPPMVKHIVVSLSQQKLFAYSGSKVVLTSLVTTGNPSLPTPKGHFTIFAKYHPYQFISPWPVGSPYWYAPAWSSYALAFIKGGYFIHDAPWRSVFGPGSNGAGQPGTNYGGTHGCVNVPVSTAQFLYTWAPIGTPVDVVA
jgi:lipoprotein-anchoring transpeptidase ErfK/SrfK